MKILAATDAKNRLGAALKFGDEDSLLIQKHGKEAYLAFTAETGRKLVLHGFASGAISRADAMNLLGIDWYGVLLDELKQAKIPLPVVSAEMSQEMVKRASEILRKNRQGVSL